MNGGRDEVENERSISCKPACTVLDAVLDSGAHGSGAGRAPVK